MKVDKVTINHLRMMKKGEKNVFELPSVESCNSGKSLAYQAQHVFECKFSVLTDYANKALTIIKNDK